ncbi:hypothetical protein HK104_003315 [Borealophlyctis nickersoniae]|nr:hypothetical protein HK104_003315 [Borealophlyctis nickersoniae]
MVHCTGPNGNLTSEMWTYSNRLNAPFGKPDVENFLVTSGGHVQWEGHTNSDWYIAEGAGSVSPEALVGGATYTPSACYRGNGDPQDAGNGRMCQLMYNCYYEPDIVLEYTIGSKTNDPEKFSSWLVGDAVTMALTAAGIPQAGPLPVQAQAEVTPMPGIKAKVLFTNNDGKGALSNLVLTGRRTNYPSDASWCHAWGGCENPPNGAGPGWPNPTASAPQRFAIGVYQGKEKLNTASISVELLEAPTNGGSDCAKFNGVASGITAAISAAFSVLNPAMSAAVGVGSGWFGAAGAVCG